MSGCSGTWPGGVRIGNPKVVANGEGMKDCCWQQAVGSSERLQITQPFIPSFLFKFSKPFTRWI